MNIHSYMCCQVANTYSQMGVFMSHQKLVTASAVLFVFMLAWSVGLAKPLINWLDPASEMNRYLINKGVLSAVFGLVFWYAGLYAAIGFRRGRGAGSSVSSLIIGLPLFALGIFAFLEPGRASLSAMELMGWTVVVLLVAFTEEGLFRGVIFEALSEAGLWRRAILTSFLFGLFHFITAGLGDFGWDISAVYGLSAKWFGLIFAAMRERAGSIWTVIFAHIVFDVVAISGAGDVETLLEPGLETYIRFLTAATVFSLWGFASLYIIGRRKGDVGKETLQVGAR